MDKIRPTFQLNRTQKNLLIAKERASFIKHCERFGWNPKEKEKQFVENFRQRDSDIIEAINLRAKKDSALELFESNALFHTDNYWQYLRIQTDIKRRMLADWICKDTSNLPIDYEYVSKIAKKMSLPLVSQENPSSLRNFLLNIPLINIFDLEFNAFVTKDTIIHGIPCVCTHTSLPEVAEFFTNLFLSVLIPDELVSTQIKFSFNDTLNRKINSQEFVWSCVSGFLALLGASTELGIAPKYQLTKIHPNLMPEFLCVLDGTSGFVALHEFGHLLLAHLEKPYTPFLELEADSFAAKTLVNVEEHQHDLSWVKLGLATIFNILEMIELLNENTLGTHPKAIERLAALETEMQDSNLSVTAAAIELLWLPSFKLFEEPASLSKFFQNNSPLNTEQTNHAS